MLVSWYFTCVLKVPGWQVLDFRFSPKSCWNSTSTFRLLFRTLWTQVYYLFMPQGRPKISSNPFAELWFGSANAVVRTGSKYDSQPFHFKNFTLLPLGAR